MANPIGCGIIFFDRYSQSVLLFRRDNKPSIPFPDCLDILGGHVESGESPRDAIVREMREELWDLRTDEPYKLARFDFFKVVHTCGAEHHIFYAEADFDLGQVKLLEGQYLLWMGYGCVRSFEFAFDFHQVVSDFFNSGLMEADHGADQ